MRPRLVFEVALLMVAMFCAAGWYRQSVGDNQRAAQSDDKLISDAQRIEQLEETIATFKLQAEIAKRDAASEIHALQTRLVEMHAAFQRKPTGKFIMHFYPRDNSID
jgi:hypothetical protein